LGIHQALDLLKILAHPQAAKDVSQTLVSPPNDLHSVERSASGHITT